MHFLPNGNPNRGRPREPAELGEVLELVAVERNEVIVESESVSDASQKLR